MPDQSKRKRNKGMFQPGKSGNPGGRLPLTEEERSVRRLTRETFNKLAQLMMSKDRSEIEDMLAGKIPYEEELFIRHMLHLGEQPSWSEYTKYLEQRIGKVPQESSVEIKARPTIIEWPEGGQTVLGVEEEKDE